MGPLPFRASGEFLANRAFCRGWYGEGCMKALCPNCGAKLDIAGGDLPASPLHVTCWMCTWTHVLDLTPTEAGPPTITVSSSRPQPGVGHARLDSPSCPETTSLSLPRDRRIRISVLAGSSQGCERELSRPLITIGRLGGGADIE